MEIRKNASILTAFLLVTMAGAAGVSADGSDPLDPNDGGADWDGDGLTNAQEQAAVSAPPGFHRKPNRLRHDHFDSPLYIL